MSPDQKDVFRFHMAFDIPSYFTPHRPPDDNVRLRARLLIEEAFEMLHASFFVDETLLALEARMYEYIAHAMVDVALPDLADAYVDIRYIVAGSELAFGFDGEATWREVHMANMRKVGGKKRSDGKQMKPEGWVGPDMHSVLIAQGWEP